MPYALVIVGLILTIAAARDNHKKLFDLLMNDFTGKNSFLWWGTSIIGIGAVGYLPKARPVTNAFLALLLVVLVLAQYKHGNNFMQEFVNSLKGVGSPEPVKSDTNQSSSGPLSRGADALAGSLRK